MEIKVDMEVTFMEFQYFCTVCLDYRDFKIIHVEEDFEVKNETITIEARYLECKECGEQILNPENEDENYISAYNIYRKRKNLMFPKEIVELREKYGISQRLMAKILGWSHATLSRYETGAIQSQSHNNELVLLQDPENFLTIIERNQGNLSSQDLERAKAKVTKMIDNQNDKSLYSVIESSFTSEPNEYNGFTQFDLEKLINVTKYFLHRDLKVYKVKLMKYLWYTDFSHFKNWTLSLTGLQYARFQMGPVPNNYDMLISLLLNEDKSVTREYIDFEYGQGELFTSIEDFDSSLFTEEEKKTLEKVYHLVSSHNSKTISELSHQEVAWIETEDRDLITYKFAEQLSLD